MRYRDAQKVYRQDSRYVVVEFIQASEITVLAITPALHILPDHFDMVIYNEHVTICYIASHMSLFITMRPGPLAWYPRPCTLHQVLLQLLGSKIIIASLTKSEKDFIPTQ